MNQEQLSKFWSVVAVLVPLIVVVPTVLQSVWSLERTAETGFMTKIADAMLNAQSPHEAKAKAEMLVSVFGDRLPRNFVENVGKTNPDAYGSRSSTVQRELVKLLAEQPNQRQQILRDWRAIFTDKWVERLDSVASSTSKKP